MFGPFGGFEILVLLVLGLLIFGPRRLPEIGRTLGRAMMEFRRAAAELRTSIEREIDLEDVKQATRSVQTEIGRIRDSIAGEVKRTVDGIPPSPEEPVRTPTGAKAAPTEENATVPGKPVTDGARGDDGGSDRGTT